MGMCGWTVNTFQPSSLGIFSAALGLVCSFIPFRCCLGEKGLFSFNVCIFLLCISYSSVAVIKYHDMIKAIYRGKRFFFFWLMAPS